MVPIENFLINRKHAKIIWPIKYAEFLGPLQWTIHSPFHWTLVYSPKMSGDYFTRDDNLRSDQFFDVLILGNKIYNSFVVIVKSLTKIVYKTWYRLPTQNETIVFRIICYEFTREPRKQKRMNRFPPFVFVPGTNQKESTEGVRVMCPKSYGL